MGWAELIALIVLMIALIAIIAIVSDLVVKPWIKMQHSARGALNEDERDVMANLLRTAERTEERLKTLEQILDAEAPGWRERERA